MAHFNESIWFELCGMGGTLKDIGNTLEGVNKNLENNYKLEHHKFMQTIYNEEKIKIIKDFLGKPLIKFIEDIHSMRSNPWRNYSNNFIWDIYHYQHEKENYLDERGFYWDHKVMLDKKMEALGVYFKYQLNEPIKIDYHLSAKAVGYVNNIILCAEMEFEIYNNPAEDNEIKYDYHTKPKCECLFCKPNCIIWKVK